MLVFYHLIASLFLFIEDGLSRSLESNASDSDQDAVRMMTFGEGSDEMVSFNLDEETKKVSSNIKYMEDIGNEKILREIFITCAERNNTIPYLTSKFEFDCYEIGTNGPCDGRDEWLVVSDENDNITFPWSVCKLNPCYHLENGIFFNDDCIEQSASSLVCHKGMWLELDIYGRGECVCTDGLLTVMDAQNFPHCYQEFLQGPCAEGEQLIQDVETRKPICVPTDCQHANQTKWNTGECLESVACGDDGIVVFKDGKLDCSVSTRQLINVPSICDDGESKDATGNCQKIYKNLGRTSRSPTGSKINFSRNTLKKLMCSKHPNKFNC